LPETHRNGFVGFVIGGKHSTKMLPEEKLISICKKINKPIILLGGPEDFEKGESIKKNFGDKVYNASGKYGSGMHFDVENSNYILLADESAGEDQYKTFCDNGCSYGGWMKVDDDLINMVMMSKYLNSGTQRFFYYILDSN